MPIVTGDIIISQLQKLYRDSSQSAEEQIYIKGSPDYEETYYLTRKSAAALCFVLIDSAVEKKLQPLGFEYSTDLDNNNFGAIYWAFDAIAVSLHERGIDASATTAEGMKFALLNALEEQQIIIELFKQGRPEREAELVELESKKKEAHNIAVDFMKKCLE